MLSNRKPIQNLHLTVAAVIEHEDKFLLVTDITPSGLKLNQPAGHVEEGESLQQAIIREVKQETNLNFIPEKVIGIYLYQSTPKQTYLRTCFKGSISGDINHPTPDPLDDGVIAAKWYDLATIEALEHDLRSPLVLSCLSDYLKGKEFSLEVLADYTDGCDSKEKL
ncbi:MAG: NUDIX domain-containing protein [Burkholderiales bacterium]